MLINKATVEGQNKKCTGSKERCCLPGSEKSVEKLITKTIKVKKKFPRYKKHVEIF